MRMLTVFERTASAVATEPMSFTTKVKMAQAESTTSSFATVVAEIRTSATESSASFRSLRSLLTVECSIHFAAALPSHP